MYYPGEFCVLHILSKILSYFVVICLLDSCRDAIGVQSPRPSVGHIENTQVPIGRSAGAYAIQESEKIEIKPIPIGDPKVRSKIRFEVVTARVIETGGKKHVVSSFRVLL